jgi:hypothetical protein
MRFPTPALKFFQWNTSMQTKTSTLICVLAAFALAVSAGCKQEGPVEKAGRQVDKTVEKAGDKIDDAADKLKKK